MSGGPTAQAQDQAHDLPEIEGVEHRFVDADGLDVHVAIAGEGSPVLLLHGWPQHWYMWRGVIERLAPQFRLIAPDLRGFGWTEAPGAGYDAETFAADQIALLDALEIETASVIGHDWGGWTAFLLGLDHSDRIERMVVCNAPHPWPKLEPRLALEIWRTWYAAALAIPVVGPRLLQQTDLAAGILRRGNVGTPFTESEIAAYADSFRDPARAHAVCSLYRYYHRAFAEGLRGRWRSRHLAVPTLLMFGPRDLYVTPRILPGYEDYADDMQLELVPDSGHFLVDEKPDLVARRALAFLS
ncbi:MAG: alpha/beta hydrolase [Actinomycetota bacterium]|nr:alpha/beta hydrolase [Actinomycetota bacterium]